MQEQQRYHKKGFWLLRAHAVRECLHFLRLQMGLYKKSEKSEVVRAENFGVALVKIAACRCFSKHVENRDGDLSRGDHDAHCVALSRRSRAKKSCGEVSRISSPVTAYFAAFSDAATGINTTRLLTMAESNEQ